MADGITDALTTEIGPLPAWAWGVAIVGGLAVGWFVLDRSPLSGAEDGAEASETPNGPSRGTEGPLRVRDGTAGTRAGSVRPGEDEARTNAEWRRMAVDALDGGSRIDEALARWLQGRRITSSQREIVDEAISEIGTPPESVPLPPDPPESEPEPEPEPEPKPEPEPEPDPEPSGPPPDVALASGWRWTWSTSGSTNTGRWVLENRHGVTWVQRAAPDSAFASGTNPF